MDDDNYKKSAHDSEQADDEYKSAEECGMPYNDSAVQPGNDEMKEYCKQLHEAYNGALSAFREVYPAADKELMSQIDKHSRKCALYLWLKFGVPMEKCITAVNEIYLDDIGKPDYPEVDINRERPYRDEDSMPIPFFIYGIIKYDKSHGTDFSSRLVACFQTLDIIYALIDGMIAIRFWYPLSKNGIQYVKTTV